MTARIVRAHYDVHRRLAQKVAKPPEKSCTPTSQSRNESALRLIGGAARRGDGQA
jgi:hypothetical protein